MSVDLYSTQQVVLFSLRVLVLANEKKSRESTSNEDISRFWYISTWDGA